MDEEESQYTDDRHQNAAEPHQFSWHKHLLSRIREVHGNWRAAEKSGRVVVEGLQDPTSEMPAHADFHLATRNVGVVPSAIQLFVPDERDT